MTTKSSSPADKDLSKLISKLKPDPAKVSNYEKEKKELHEKKRMEYFESVCDKRYLGSNLAHLETNKHNENSLKQIKGWIDGFYHGAWLVINGVQGTGKSLVKNIIIKMLYDEQSEKVKSINLFDMFIDYNDAVRIGALRGYFNKLTSYRILVIDEIGRRKMTETFFDFVFSVVDYFYSNRKSLVLITNLPITDEKNGLGQYVDLDRLKECATSVTFSGPSMRGKKP